MRITPSVTESATVAWTAKVRELRAAGRPILSLGLGEPDYPTPPHVVEAAHAAMKAGFTTYSAAAGLPELREAIAAKLRGENGIASARPDEVVVTPGAKNALFLAAAALLEPGDEAVILTPGYVSNKPILALAEPAAAIVEAPLAGPAFALDTAKLDRAVTETTKLLLVNYPNNPTGRMLQPAESAFLLDLLRRRRGLHVVSDEIYESLPLGALKPFSPASAADVAARVVTVNGFSKSHAMTGWRIGYVHAAKPIADKILKIHQQLNTNVAAFTQKAALAALQGPQDHRRDFVARLQANVTAYERFLAANPKAPGCAPEGGFFSFLDVGAAGLGSDLFAARLLDAEGVAVLPGATFGAGFDHCVRISLAVAEKDFAEALSRLGRFLGKAAK